MNHSHVYGILNDTCYRIPVIPENSSIVRPNDFVSSVQPKLYPDAKVYALNISINTTEYQERISNFDQCKKVIEWVKGNKASVIADLRDTFKIEIDYALYSAQNELIDEGTTVRTVEPSESFVLFQTSETNEMQYRKAIKFSQTIKFNKLFPASYGLIGSLSKQYRFEIHAIRLKGSVDGGILDSTPLYTSNRVLDMSGREHMATTVTSKDSVTLYDTSVVGITFPYNIIPFKPTELGINVNILLNEFCEFGDEAELFAALSESGGSISSQPGSIYPCHPNIHPHPGFPPCGNGPIIPLIPNKPNPKPDNPSKPDDGKDDNTPKDDEPAVDPSMKWELQIADGYETENDIVYTVGNGENSVALETITKYLPDVTAGSKVYFKRTTDGWKPFVDTGASYYSIFVCVVSDVNNINIETAKANMGNAPSIGDKVYWGWTYNI